MKNQYPRTVFFGTPDFAIPALEALIESGLTPVAVVTTPDEPAGRKQILTPPPLKTAALAHGIPVLQPPTLKNGAFLEECKALKLDLAVVVAYGKIIPEPYLAVPKHGFINIHPSLLPKYRGPSPIQTAILNGEKKTGVTIMLLDAEVDHGPILAQTPYTIPETASYADAAHDLAVLGAALLVETLPGYLNGEIIPREQDHKHATFCRLLTRADGEIDWAKPAADIYNQIRALGTEPGAWTTWRGKTLKILRARPEDETRNGQLGQVIVAGRSAFVITGDDLLALESVQIEGGKPLPIADFLNGNPDFSGAILES